MAIIPLLNLTGRRTGLGFESDIEICDICTTDGDLPHSERASLYYIILSSRQHTKNNILFTFNLENKFYLRK